MNCNDIIKRFSVQELDRKTADSTYDLISRYVVPFRGDFFKPNDTEGEVNWREARYKFDDTAPHACEMLASAMQADLTNPATQWFGLSFRNKELMKDEEIARWLGMCQSEMYKELQESNFDLEAAEFYTDLCSYGMGNITEEAESEIEWKGLDFKALPLKDTYFEENIKGQVAVLYRRIKWTAGQIAEKFGDKIPDSIKSKAESGSNDKHEIIFCVYPRKDKMTNDTSKILDPLDRPYGFKYVLRAGNEMLGEEGGYYEMPNFVTRWRKVSGSKLGHSPAHVCLSDILSANQLVEETFEALGKVIDPSTIVTKRGLLSDLDLGRGGLTVARSKEDIWSYESKARFDIGDLKLSELQNSINKAFYVDQLMLKESPAMTATEAQIRYRLMQRLLGPTLGRLMNDFLDPLIKRTFNIMYRAGRFPERPTSIPNGTILDIEYTGPLAQAQRMSQNQATMNWVVSLTQMAQADPNVLDLPDFDAIARGLADGVPVEYLKGAKAVKQIRDERQQKQAQMEQMDQMGGAGAAAEAMGRGAKALKEGLSEEANE